MTKHVGIPLHSTGLQYSSFEHKITDVRQINIRFILLLLFFFILDFLDSWTFYEVWRKHTWDTNSNYSTSLSIIAFGLDKWLICWTLTNHDIFSINEPNNCFIIRSPSFSSYLNHSLTAQGSDLPFFTREGSFNCVLAEPYLQQNTFRQYYTWADHYL